MFARFKINKQILNHMEKVRGPTVKINFKKYQIKGTLLFCKLRLIIKPH